MANNLQQFGHDIHFLLYEGTTQDYVESALFWGGDYFHPVFPEKKRAGLRHKHKVRKFLLTSLKSICPLGLYLLLKRLKTKPVNPKNIDSWFDMTIVKPIVDVVNHLNPDIVLVEYTYKSKIFEYIPSSICKVLDTHDKLADRHALYSKMGLNPEWISASQEAEAIGLNRADYVIAITEEEAIYFRQITKKPVVVIGHNVKMHPSPQSHKDVGKVITFIGAQNAINLSAVKFMLNEVMPLVYQKAPDVGFQIAGGVTNDIDPEWVQPELIKLIPNANLESLYANTSVVVNPALCGTGLRIKTIEALAYSQAVVTTSAGASGLLHGAGNAFLLADDAGAFAHAIVSLLLNKDKRTALKKKAQQFVAEYNENVLRNTESVFGRVGKER